VRTTIVRLRCFAFLLVSVGSACSGTTTKADGDGGGAGPLVLRDGVARLLRDPAAGERCWRIVTDVGEEPGCPDSADETMDVDQVAAGPQATAIGGHVNAKVHRVEVSINGVKADAKLKGGYFLLNVQARGNATVQAFGGDGRRLVDWAGSAVYGPAATSTRP